MIWEKSMISLCRLNVLAGCLFPFYDWYPYKIGRCKIVFLLMRGNETKLIDFFFCCYKRYNAVIKITREYFFYNIILYNDIHSISKSSSRFCTFRDHPFKMLAFLREEGSNIDQIWQRIVVKNADGGG